MRQQTLPRKISLTSLVPSFASTWTRPSVVFFGCTRFQDALFNFCGPLKYQRHKTCVTRAAPAVLARAGRHETKHLPVTAPLVVFVVSRNNLGPTADKAVVFKTWICRTHVFLPLGTAEAKTAHHRLIHYMRPREPDGASIVSAITFFTTHCYNILFWSSKTPTAQSHTKREIRLCEPR